MKWIRSLNDLTTYGIEPLTGEACGLMYRILCDVTADGLRILEKCLGVKITPAEAWNRGSNEHPHVGSVMLAQPMLVPLAVFALLESGCTECWLPPDGSVSFDDAAMEAREAAHVREALAHEPCVIGHDLSDNVRRIAPETCEYLRVGTRSHRQLAN